MADLQRAREGYAFERFAASPQAAASQRRSAAEETVRPRIGRGPRRTKRRSRSRMDMGVALRALAVSCAVAVFVLGGFFLLHSLGLGRSEEEAHAPQPAVAVAGLVPTTAPAAQAPAEDAGRIAALLSSEPAPAEAPAPIEAAPPPAAAPGPSQADFSRPAFLEPREADKADADAADDPAPQADGGAVPLPAARPAMAQASAADGEETGSVGREGRITTAINLRSGPQRGSAVLATLEAGTKVTVYSCKSWCEVAAGDKRGYVYSRAVDR